MTEEETSTLDTHQADPLEDHKVDDLSTQSGYHKLHELTNTMQRRQENRAQVTVQSNTPGRLTNWDACAPTVIFEEDESGWPSEHPIKITWP